MQAQPKTQRGLKTALAVFGGPTGEVPVDLQLRFFEEPKAASKNRGCTVKYATNKKANRCFQKIEYFREFKPKITSLKSFSLISVSCAFYNRKRHQTITVYSTRNSMNNRVTLAFLLVLARVKAGDVWSNRQFSILQLGRSADISMAIITANARHFTGFAIFLYNDIL